MAGLSFLRASTAGAAMAVLVLAVGGALLLKPWRLERESGSCSLLANSDFILYSTRVVTPEGVISAAVEVKNGKITSVKEGDIPSTSEVPIINYGSNVISPGLVDLHVHMNEPGREEWEGAETGTKAAAAGGMTTIAEMPLNSVPTTTTVEALTSKLAVTKEKLKVDVAYWGGLVLENAGEPAILESLLEAGVIGLKSFMCPSGINDFSDTNITHMKEALPLLARHKKLLFVHAEMPQPISAVDEKISEGDPRSYSTYLASRPPHWEHVAVQQLVELAHGTVPGGSYDGARIHVVHLSASECLPLIKEAKAAGAAFSVETCPHYLTFSAEEISDGQTQYKCAPPIRSENNREILWQAVKDGLIDMLASDHSPSPPELKLLKEGNFIKAWGGISGLQFNLPASWTFGRQHGVTLVQLAELWSRRPAELARLASKGTIAVGKDADFVIWNPEASFVVDESFPIFHKHKVTPYFGMTLSGQVLGTFVRGQLVYQNGTHADGACGKQLLT